MKNYWLDKIPAGKFSSCGPVTHPASFEKFLYDLNLSCDGEIKLLKVLLEKYKDDEEVLNAINFLQTTLERKSTITGSVIPFPSDAIVHFNIGESTLISGTTLPPTTNISHSYCGSSSSSSSSAQYCCSSSSSSSSSMSKAYNVGVDPADHWAADIVTDACGNLDIFYPDNPIKDELLNAVSWTSSPDGATAEFQVVYTPVIPATMKGTIACSAGEFNFAFDENGKWSTYRDGNWWVGQLNHQTGILTMDWHGEHTPQVIANYEYGKEI